LDHGDGISHCRVCLVSCFNFHHEITHLLPEAFPVFRTAWNILAGIPLLLPQSCMKEFMPAIIDQQHMEPAWTRVSSRQWAAILDLGDYPW